MRDIAIKMLERTVWVAGAAILVAAGWRGAQELGAEGGSWQQGAIIIGAGVLAAVVAVGVVSLLIGIHHNTRRAAEAMERMSRSRPAQTVGAANGTRATVSATPSPQAHRRRIGPAG